MTSEEKERLLGMVLMGTSTQTALEVLGLTPFDILHEQDSDPAFRNGYLAALHFRQALSSALPGDQPE